jgi:DNA-binding XRE family transcriptional regulator
MATMCFALWLEEIDLAGTNRLIMIFIGVVAVALLIMAIALLVISVASAKAIKAARQSADEIKDKVLPLIEVATEIAKSGQALLHDVTPQVKLISENLAETSKIARSAVQQIETTVSDANLRTQRQVARVDGMVTAALTTTTEVVEAVAHGLRAPAQKIAAMAGQAKLAFDGLLARFKARTAGTQSR